MTARTQRLQARKRSNKSAGAVDDPHPTVRVVTVREEMGTALRDYAKKAAEEGATRVELKETTLASNLLLVATDVILDILNARRAEELVQEEEDRKLRAAQGLKPLEVLEAPQPKVEVEVVTAELVTAERVAGGGAAWTLRPGGRGGTWALVMPLGKGKGTGTKFTEKAVSKSLYDRWAAGGGSGGVKEACEALGKEVAGCGAWSVLFTRCCFFPSALQPYRLEVGPGDGSKFFLVFEVAPPLVFPESLPSHDMSYVTDVVASGARVLFTSDQQVERKTLQDLEMAFEARDPAAAAAMVTKWRAASAPVATGTSVATYVYKVDLTGGPTRLKVQLGENGEWEQLDEQASQAANELAMLGLVSSPDNLLGIGFTHIIDEGRSDDDVNMEEGNGSVTN